jgi:hypothetical protein
MLFIWIINVGIVSKIVFQTKLLPTETILEQEIIVVYLSL